MSDDVFSAIDPSEKEPVVYERHCTIKLRKEIYCTYTGFCEKRRVINRDDLCLFCEYRTPLNIPAMIKKELEE